MTHPWHMTHARYITCYADTLHEGLIVDFIVSYFFLGDIVKDVDDCGFVDVDGNLPLITEGTSI